VHMVAGRAATWVVGRGHNNMVRMMNTLTCEVDCIMGALGGGLDHRIKLDWLSGLTAFDRVVVIAHSIDASL